MHIGRHLGSKLFQSGQRDVGDSDIGTHSGSYAGSSFAHRTTTKNQHLCRLHARHTGHELALAALGLLKIIGSVLHCHASGYLAHWDKQRQRVVGQLNSLVGDTRCAAAKHGIGKRSVASEMEIGEHHLPLSYESILWRDRFLDLNYHVGLAINILNGGQHLCSGSNIVGIWETTTLACTTLNDNRVTMPDKFGNARRGHAHTVLIVFNLFWNTYFHIYKSLKVN